MAIEIERKFICSPLILAELFELIVLRTATQIVQNMLSLEPYTRIRISKTLGDHPFWGKDTTGATLTVKSKSVDASREEYESPIEVSAAREILNKACSAPHTVKTRFELQDTFGKKWDIDIYHGVNAGLIVGEIQLNSNDEKFQTPCWVIREVTHDPQYSNQNLAIEPVITTSFYEGSKVAETTYA